MTRAEAARLLGVPVDADRAVVQRAFLRRARLVHPDALPDVDDAARRTAAERFDALTRARAVLETPAPIGPRPPETRRPARGSGQPSAGIGNGLLLLVLLVFLLVALVTLDVAVRTHGFENSSLPVVPLRAPVA